MAVVLIKTQVDKASLAAAEATISNTLSKINGKTINLNIDSKSRMALNALAKLAQAEAKLAVEENKRLVAAEKTAQVKVQSEAKVKAAVEKTAQATQKAAAETEKRARAEINANSKSITGFKETTVAAEQTGDSITKLAGKVALWGAATTLIYGPIRAFQAALDTLKAVDDKLVIVRKVTDLTTAEMEPLEKQAYKVAAAYGESADAYLQSVSEFARAGYQEQSAALAELATKTQIVGDVSAETANQFLLAVDAGYKLNGSITELSKVLDGANEIDNKYATSIEKIAEGIGIVAPVAAQAKISVEEMTAAIGTITAVTQRSGSEAARAFRALVLNILGDTKTEIDEGVTWTTGEIAGLQDVIRQYAPDAYNAAKATGEMINPMKAIGGLAQAMEDGLLTEARLMEMVSDIGGKLRSSQLLALIQNWDMYEEMLGDYAGAIGSADKEVENALDSWTKKSERLNTRWTQLVSNLVETEHIKGGLDVVTFGIQLLDNAAGRTLIQVVAFTVALKGLSAITIPMGTMYIPNVITGITAMGKVLLTAAKNGETAAAAMALFNGVIRKNPIYISLIALGILRAVTGLGNLKNRVEETRKAYETQKEVVEGLNEEYDKLYGKDTEYDQLISKGNNLTEIERRRLAVLEAQRAELEKQREIELREEFNKRPTASGAGGMSRAEATVLNTKNALSEAFGELEKGAISQEEYISKLQEVISKQAEEVAQLKEYAEVFTDELTPAEYEQIELYDEIVDKLADYADAQDEAAEATEGHTSATLDLDEALSKLSQIEKNYKTLKEAVEQYNSTGRLSADVIAALVENDLIKYLNFSTGALKINEEAFKADATAAQVAAIKASGLATVLGYTSGALEGTKQAAFQAVSGLDAAGNAAERNANKAKNAIGKWLGLATAMNAATGYSSVGTGVLGANLALKQTDVSGVEDDIKDLLDFWSYQDFGSGGGGGSSSKSENKFDKLKDELDETLQDMEHQIFLWEIDGTMTSAIVAKYREMQDEVHALAEKYREMGLDENSDYIQDLQKQWQEYEEAIEKIAKDLWDELEDAVKKELEAAEKVKDEEIAAIDRQIDALKQTADAENELLTLEEKRLAVAEAQEALAKAQAERTIRVYNAATGQWEWIADASSVESAKEQLKQAQDDLDEYLKDRELERQIALLEQRKEAIEAQFDAYEEMWGAITESVAEPTRDISEILADINANGLPAMKNAIDSVTAMLEELGNYEVSVGGTATGGSLTGGAKDYENDTTDYAALMLVAPDKATFDYYAAERAKKIAAQNIDLEANAWETNKELEQIWAANNTYDSGGILRGMGGIKATRQDEMVLPPDLTEAMLNPQSDSVFRERVKQLGYLFGNGALNLTAGTTNNMGGNSVTNNGGPYYFEKIVVSERDANTLTIAELARRAKALSLYTSA